MHDPANEVSFDVDPNTIEYFHATTINIDIQIGQKVVTIPISGDIALIPVDKDDHIAPQSIFPVDFNTIYKSLFLLSVVKLDVLKNGATTAITTGYLSRPAHMAVPIDDKLFVAQFSGQFI